MKKYNTVLLDLDGTISNTYSGIVKCLGDACAKYGANLADYDVRKFIGPPLSSTFAVIFPGDERRQKEALTYYRERYLEDGIYDNEMYDGIDDFAEGLRKMGVTVGVATSKYEKYAVEVLRKLGMLEHVDFVCGSETGRVSKSEIINYALKTYGVDKDKCLMVGDTFYDLQGAEKCGIDAVGILYGFGTREEMEVYPHLALLNTVAELKEFVYKIVDKK